MPESEDHLLARIAKHNGTTVEEERAKALKPRTFNPLEDSEDVRAEKARMAGEEYVPSAVPSLPPNSDSQSLATIAKTTNPYATALIAIYVVGYLLGIVLTMIGATNAASYGPYSTDNGIVELVLGGGFFDLAVVAMLVHIGVAAVLHRLDRT